MAKNQPETKKKKNFVDCGLDLLILCTNRRNSSPEFVVTLEQQ